MKIGNEGFVERVENKHNDLSVVNAARVSFAKYKDAKDESDAKLIRYLAKNNHWTPFGHARHAFAIQIANTTDMVNWLMSRNAGWEVRRGKIANWYIIEGSIYNWLGPVDDLPPLDAETYAAIVVYLKSVAGCGYSVNAFGLSAESERHYSLFVVPSKHETYRIKAPLFVLRQFMRSNVGIVYNEVSRRYVDDTPEVFIPEEWRKRPESGIKQGSSNETVRVFSAEQINARLASGREWPYPVDIETAYGDAIEHTVDLYEQLITAGVAPEMARMVLPTALYSEIWMTASPAAIARIVSLRNNRGESNHAQKEIEAYARAIETLSDMRGVEQPEGTVPES